MYKKNLKILGEKDITKAEEGWRWMKVMYCAGTKLK